VWHFVKFCGLLQQITVNTAVNSQLKENQCCCSKLCISVNVTPRAFADVADKAITYQLLYFND